MAINIALEKLRCSSVFLSIQTNQKTGTGFEVKKEGEGKGDRICTYGTCSCSAERHQVIL